VYAQFRLESYRRLGIQLLAGPDLEVVGLVTGGPAEDSGLRAGDLLEAVNGRPIVSTAEVQAVRFEAEAVTPSFRRPGQRERLSVTVRPVSNSDGASVPVPKPEARRLGGDVGYVRPPGFDCAGDTCNQLATAIQQAIRRVDEAPTLRLGCGPSKRLQFQSRA
jgi:C-terminal processing protease CtpA/Prc